MEVVASVTPINTGILEYGGDLADAGAIGDPPGDLSLSLFVLLTLSRLADDYRCPWSLAELLPYDDLADSLLIRGSLPRRLERSAERRDVPASQSVAIVQQSSDNRRRSIALSTCLA